MSSTRKAETGVTSSVKVLRALDADDRDVARGVVQMPHVVPRDGQYPPCLSTMLRTTLPPGRCRVELADFFSMSHLQANASYGGPGGPGGAINDAAVHAVQVLVLPDAS